MENLRKNINFILNLLLLFIGAYFFIFFRNYDFKNPIELINHEILFEEKEQKFIKNPIIMSLYTIKHGDTLSSLVENFPDGAEVLFINNPHLDKTMTVGTKLKIFNDNYTYYSIKEEDTFLKLISEFKLSSPETLKLNDLKTYDINSKKKLFIKLPKLNLEENSKKLFYYKAKNVESIENLANKIEVPSSDVKKINSFDSKLLSKDQILIVNLPIK